MPRFSLMSLMLAALPALAAADTNGTAEHVTGLWLTEKKGIIVDLYDCDGNLCGRTVWLKKMNHKNGAPRLDAKNPDPALRERHWCGMEVISNVRPDGPDEWDNGEIYDPKSGDTFDFAIERKGEGLKVRGYLGVKMLGKSEFWTRTDAADVALCAAPAQRDH